MLEETEIVLDHGFVTLRNIAGPTRRPELGRYDADDRDVAKAARMSFGREQEMRTLEQDMKLADYLFRNRHTSPFEMIQIWIEVKVPIFVDRQLVRHRTWRRNETSGRYVVLPGEWYIPATVGGKAANVKQGQEDNLPEDVQAMFKDSLNLSCQNDYDRYLRFMDLGVAPEHARMFLHANHYVHWLGNVDLSNMFSFLRLRMHSHAQVEAQAYARAILSLLRPHLPELCAIFDKHCTE